MPKVSFILMISRIFFLTRQKQICKRLVYTNLFSYAVHIYVIIWLLLCRCKGGDECIEWRWQTNYYRLHYVCWWRTLNKMQMIMTKTAVALSKYSICLSPIGWTGNWGTHTHSQEIRFNCFPYQIFSAVWFFWQISTANKYAIKRKNAFIFGRDFSHVQRNWAIYIYASIYYILDIIT